MNQHYSKCFKIFRQTKISQVYIYDLRKNWTNDKCSVIIRDYFALTTATIMNLSYCSCIALRTFLKVTLISNYSTCKYNYRLVRVIKLTRRLKNGVGV